MHNAFRQFGDLGDIVEHYYKEPHRYYHTTEHINRMFDDAKNHGIELNNVQQLAILFHDIVYLPFSKSNETDSVRLMNTIRGQRPTLFENFDLGAHEYAFVSHVILDTIKHSSCIEDSDVVLDLDLLGLADPYAEYMATGELIRQEFSHATDNEFQTGRLRFINSFLNRERIFHTDLFYDKYELRARDNLKHELEMYNE